MLLSSVLAMAPVDLPTGYDLERLNGGIRDTNAPAHEHAGANQVLRLTSDSGTKRGLQGTGDGHWRAHSTDNPRGTNCVREYPARLRPESTTEPRLGFAHATRRSHSPRARVCLVGGIPAHMCPNTDLRLEPDLSACP